MKKSIYLDFTLPVFLQKDLANRYSSFLRVLIKNIEKTSNIKFYLTLNLFNEFHLSDESFKELIKVSRSLVEQDRAEIVLSSSFYTSNLSKEHIHVYDILYSEYFSGFHLGLPRDFEGDTCIMMKNLHTVFFPGGEINSYLVNSSKLLGIERIFLDSKYSNNENFVFKNLKVLSIDTNLKVLFEGFVTADVLLDFMNHISSSVIYYVNVFELFCKYRHNIDTNFSNLLYLLDKGNFDWDLSDIDDENMIYQDKLSDSILEKMVDNEVKDSDDFYSLKEGLIKNIIHTELKIEEGVDEFFRSPIWRRIGVDSVDSRNMFNLRLMSLTSKEVNRENILLREDLKIHLNDIIDELIVSEHCSNGLDHLLASFKDRINLK